MNTDLIIASGKLIKTIINNANNNSKTSIEKVNAVLNEYKSEKLEYDNYEKSLDDSYNDKIKVNRNDKELAYNNYIDQRTILFNDYKSDNNLDSLHKLLNFQINTVPNLKKIYEDIKYENIYTKYANIRMLSYK
jgi:hypothetical protein